MATKKKKGSYNPFYIPSLDALKAQSRQEAQAQIDAAVAALPKTGDVQGQFDKSGREFKAMDTAYQSFLQQQQTAAPALFNTGVDVNATTATGVTDPGAAQTAQQASNALSMQGFGFANQRTQAVSGAAAKANENQQRNRRQLNDALLQLTNQIAAEKAKFSPLYYQTLNQKKADAMAAYQAYLANQLNNAQLSAQISNDNAQLALTSEGNAIKQQNANTAAQKARDAAAKAAANDPAAVARSKRRNSGRTATQKWMNAAIDYEKAGPEVESVVIPYTVTIVSGHDLQGNPQYKTFPAVRAKPETSLADVRAQVIRTYHLTDPEQIASLSIVPGKKETTKTPGPVTRRTWTYIYNRAVSMMKSYGWTDKTSKRLVENYLRDAGLTPPPKKPPPGSHGPGK
jgi:hypothetical protein